MTEIRIKAPSLKRAITITKIDGSKDEWELTQVGRLPLRFFAVNIGEASETGMARCFELQNDPSRPKVVRQKRTAQDIPNMVQPGQTASTLIPKPPKADKAAEQKSKVE